MSTINTLLQHRSIRKYKTDPIPEVILDLILEAAIRGSNTGNMQLYSIIVTRNQAMKAALAPFHFNQAMVTEAPVLLTFCADVNRFNVWCKARNAEPGYDNFLWYTNASIDATIAAQNACIAAEANGLGVCYLGTTTYTAEKIIDVLQLPKGVVPITTVVVGYAADSPHLTDRLPKEAVLHNETYHNYSPENINQFYAEKEALPLTQQLIHDNQVASLAHVFTEKRYKKTDNELFSKKYIDVLTKQGLM